MNRTSIEAKRVTLRSDSPSQGRLFAIQRYGLAVLSVSVALGGALLMEGFHTRDVGVPLFLFAVAVTASYGGSGAAALALLLSCISFDYFFVEPFHTFNISRSDLPYFIVFTSFASLVAWFSAIRRRAEAALREARDKLEIEVAERTQQASLLNLTHDTIFVRDMSDVITYWNRGAQELYGWTAEDAIGKSANELLRTVFPAPIEQIREELLRSGRWDGELEKAKVDGTKVIVASRWSLQRDDHGRPAAILETNNDITERKLREEEIRVLNEDLGKRTAGLEVTNKELEAFAYTISHDLRAPLRHMVGFTELLQKDAASVLNEKSQRYVMTILDSAKRMGNLIDDLLAFSRIGRAETRKTIVDMDQLVHEVLGEVRQETDGRDVVWRVGALPACYGDRSMLRLALVNLVSNAVKFTRTRPNEQIDQVFESRPKFAHCRALLQTIPGIGQRVAQIIIAEIGVEVEANFPTDKHLASWCGLCPGNNASGGKRKSGRTRDGNSYLRSALVQAAWAAHRSKNTYLGAQYRRLARRISKKKATIAVAHSLIVIAYYVLVRDRSYQELGGDYFDRQHVEQQRAYLLRRLEALGCRVTVEQNA